MPTPRFACLLLRLYLLIGGYGGLCCCSLPAFAQILATDTINADQRYGRIPYFTDTYTQQLQLVDTTLHRFEWFGATQQQPAAEQLYLGNWGQPHAPLVFNEHRQLGFNLGWRQYDQYFIAPDSVRYFYSLYPLSDLRYLLGPAQEQQMKVLFTLPISSNLNLTADYRRIVAPGTYSRQKAKTTAFAASLRYSTTNQRYQLLGNYTLNRAYTELSGGYDPHIIFRGDTLNAILDSLVTPRTIVTPLLSAAKSILQQNRVFVQQTYSIGKLYPFLRYANDTLPPKFPTYRIGHRTSYQQQQYSYTDTDPSEDYYPYFRLSQSATADTLAAQVVDNEVFVAFFGKRRLSDSTGYAHTLSARAGLRQQWIRTYRMSGVDTLFANPIEGVPQDTSLQALFSRQQLHATQLQLHLENPPEARFNYYLDVAYGLWGAYQNDLSLSARTAYRLPTQWGSLQASTTLQRLTPDYLTQQYTANSYAWSNPNWQKTNSLQLRATYANPRYRLQITYANHTFDNYVIWLPTAQPDQLTGSVVNVSQLIVQKDFTIARHWHLDNYMVLQLSNNQQIPLPTWCSRHSVYWQNSLFKGASLLRIGINLSTQSNYYAPGYLPAIGQFVVQHTEVQQYYPIVDAFLTAKIKRLRMFVKVQHLNQGIISQKSYFTAYQYPAQDRSFYFGVSWMFFD